MQGWQKFNLIFRSRFYYLTILPPSTMKTSRISANSWKVCGVIQAFKKPLRDVRNTNWRTAWDTFTTTLIEYQWLIMCQPNKTFCTVAKRPKASTNFVWISPTFHSYSSTWVDKERKDKSGCSVLIKWQPYCFWHHPQNSIKSYWKIKQWIGSKNHATYLIP